MDRGVVPFPESAKRFPLRRPIQSCNIMYTPIIHGWEEALMVAVRRPNSAAIGITAAAGVLVIVMISLSVAGTRPYGEQAILDQIQREDSALCSKLGIAPATQKFPDCLIDLADLRQRHVDLLNAWGWL